MEKNEKPEFTSAFSQQTRLCVSANEAHIYSRTTHRRDIGRDVRSGRVCVKHSVDSKLNGGRKVQSFSDFAGDRSSGLIKGWIRSKFRGYENNNKTRGIRMFTFLQRECRRLIWLPRRSRRSGGTVGAANQCVLNAAKKNIIARFVESTTR